MLYDPAQVDLLVVLVESGELDAAVEMLASQLEASGVEPFASAARGGLATSTCEVREWLAWAAGIEHALHRSFPALSVEMNEFDINPHLWFVGVEAWGEPVATFSDILNSAVGGLSSPVANQLLLPGWEQMQEAFVAAAPAYQAAGSAYDEATQRAWTTAVFLVHVHFLRLMQRALAGGPLAGVEVPVAVTTHAMDLGIVLTPVQGTRVGRLPESHRGVSQP